MDATHLQRGRRPQSKLDGELCSSPALQDQ
jgi:hypothetical protein